LERVDSFTIRFSDQDRDLLMTHMRILKTHHDCLRADKVKLHGKHGAMAMTEMRGALRVIMDAFAVIIQASK
jgi:hypothetical protein